MKKMYNTEVEYVKLFSQSYESNNFIRFSDDCIPDMYTHNFVFIKNNQGVAKTKEIILSELEQRKKVRSNFLRVEFNFSLDNDLLNELSIKPQVTKYDYMYINPKLVDKLMGNQKCIIRKAVSLCVRIDVVMNIY